MLVADGGRRQAMTGDGSSAQSERSPGPQLRSLPPPRSAAPDYAFMLARVARGDREAETELVLALSEPLAMVLRRRLGGDHRRADLQQDTLLVVLEAAREGRIEEPRALIEFTLETARRMVMNAERKVLRQRTQADAELLEGMADLQQVSVLDVLAAEERQHCVRAVLASMRNERDRQVLYSYYIDEQPTAQVQARFALDSVQLGRVLHRARQRFLALWQALRADPTEGPG
jgi:DNA-directed RNA polymerase specialized sigma24 family protein